MKELIRSLRLCYLSDTPLTDELKRLDDAIHFIEDVFDKCILKTDSDNYPNYKFYFIGKKNYFQYNSKTSKLYCRYEDFWHVLEMKFQYSNMQEACDLIKYTAVDYFNNKTVAPAQLTIDGFDQIKVIFNSKVVRLNEYTTPQVEEHFNNLK